MIMPTNPVILAEMREEDDGSPRRDRGIGRFRYARAKTGGRRAGRMKPCMQLDAGALEELRSNNSNRYGSPPVH